MRTTVTLDDDVAAAVEALRRERNLGLSEAVNQLARAGMRQPDRPPRRSREVFVASSLGMRLDVSNVAELLDQLEDDERGRRAR